MRVRYALAATLAIGAAISLADLHSAPQQSAPSTAASPHRTLLDRYCVGCHNQRTKTANLSFDTMDLANIAQDAVVWERAVRKLRGGMMPPPGMPRPERADVDSFVTFLENTLDAAATAHPDPGRVALHRLNRAEYQNAVEEILGVRVNAAALLPTDDMSDGFDNIANVLKVSPSFLDQYILAARFVTDAAIGSAEPKSLQSTLLPPPSADQSAYVEGLPLGTRGGFVSEHLFPATGVYQFSLTGMMPVVLGYLQGVEFQQRVILTIDGEKMFEDKMGGEADLKFVDQKQAPAISEIRARFEKIKVPVKAGSHKIGVAFVERARSEDDDLLQSFKPAAGIAKSPRIASVILEGPLQITGPADTDTRRKIISCSPQSEREEIPCATTILSRVARQAFRRPVTDRDLAAPLQFFRDSRASGGFDAGIQSALTAILASPKFLYRAEPAPAGVAAGSIYRLPDLQLASRLAFFLWSQNPDDTLIDLAVDGKLSDPKVLQQQVRRMLADPRAKSLVDNFAFQWLGLRALDDMQPDPFLFPNFDASLRAGFAEELKLFVGSVIQEDRSVLDLLNANDTFVNERVALHYGIPNVRGSQFRRVTLDDPNRWGLLGKGGVLMVTSYPNRTAPVLRGAWILERILGTPPAPPPPNVEAFPETAAGAKALSVRERMEVHRKNPSCNACHGVMDPLGFALENYNAIGEWQAVDRWAGIPIDASGKLVTGAPVSNPADLRKALSADPRAFVQTMTEKMMMYALGRSVEAHDMPAVRKIVRDAAAQNYKFSAIAQGIVNSAAFQTRVVELSKGAE